MTSKRGPVRDEPASRSRGHSVPPVIEPAGQPGAPVVSATTSSGPGEAQRGEDPVSKLGAALQSALTDSLRLMQQIQSSLPREEHERWRKHIAGVQGGLRMAQKALPGESMRPEVAPSDAGLDPKRLKEFAEQVVQARAALNMSQSQLARRAGLAKKTIWNVEQGVSMPSRDTIFRLLFVKELGLSLDQVPWRDQPPLEAGSLPNCWIAPGYEPLKLFAEMQEAVHGPGGRLEQTFAYLDHQSADNWNKLANHPVYDAKYRSRAPMDRVAQTILDDTAHARLDIMALGAGDGVQETRLVKNILASAEAKQREADIRLFLVDISQPLLSNGYQHAAQAFGREGNVLVQAIQGNFHYWARYTQLHHRDPSDHRRHLITFFGATIGNLDNEFSFFQHSLVGLAPGDLLLLDVGVALADASQPDEILRKDPSFKRGPSQEHHTWLTGPLRSYCEDVLRIDLHYTLNLLTVVPGSYAIDVVADVEFRDGSKKQFPQLFRFKRYDPIRLAATLRVLGWELLLSAPYGPDAANPDMVLLLFRRLPPVA